MRYITYTQIDAVTGIPVTQEPARNGPTTPAGARFGFALESRYPTATPTFYGTILAADDHTAPGILSVTTKAEYDAAEAAEMEARKRRQIDGYRVAIQAVIDAAAVSRRYDNGVSLASYVGSTNEAWAVEAQIFVAWRDAVWAFVYAELDRVLAGERATPSISDFLSELPAINWSATEKA